MGYEEFFDDNVNEDTVGTGGFDTVAAGFYVVRVADVQEGEDKMTVDFEIVPGGTKPAEVGKVHREYLSLNSKDMNRKRRNAFALATNIMTREHMAAARKAGHGLVVEYPSAVGQLCVIEVEHETKNILVDEQYVADPSGKIIAKIPYDNIWHVNDKTVAKKGVKVDPKLMDKAELADAFGGGGKPSTPAAVADDF